MGKALEGEHYCKSHQGNHSHYDEHNCTVCKLKARLEAVGAVVEAAKNFCAYDPKVEARPDSAVEYMSRELALKNAVKELDPPRPEEK